MPRDICPASQACPRTLAHAAFPTTWHGYPDSLQHRYTPSATHAHTHTLLHRPLRPGPQSWRCCRTCQLQPCQPPPPPPPASSRAGFFQPEPRSLYCKLWKLMSDAAAPARYLFISSLLPAETTLRSGEPQPGRGRGCGGREHGGRDHSGAPGPPRGGHEHQAGGPAGGGRRRGQGPGGRASGPSPAEPAAPAQTGHPVPAQGLGRPAAPGRPQEARHLQGLGEATLSPPLSGAAGTPPPFSGSAGRVQTPSLQTPACPQGRGRRP